jgi:hypothetical protein
MRKARKDIVPFVLMLLLPLVLLLAGCGSATIAPSPTVAEPEVEATATPPPPSPAPTEEASAWQVVIQTAAQHPTSMPARVAVFLDENLGLTGGVDTRVGKAHYTTDGGVTWDVAESSRG